MAKTCPNSNTEYEGESCSCPECLPVEKDVKTVEKEGWKVVTTVANDIEFELVAGLLKMGEIPVIRQVSDVDGCLEIMLGVPLSGIHVMVPEDKYEEALGLINTEVDEKTLEEEEEKTE
jgi:hypothetical protein